MSEIEKIKENLYSVTHEMAILLRRIQSLEHQVVDLSHMVYRLRVVNGEKNLGSIEDYDAADEIQK